MKENLMNNTELRAMSAIGPEFRIAWVRALEKEEGSAPLGAIARMLEYPETLEIALGVLKKRADCYPQLVAKQIIYKMVLSDQIYLLGIQALRAIQQSEVRAALKEVSKLENEQNPKKWAKLVRKIRKTLSGR